MTNATAAYKTAADAIRRGDKSTDAASRYSAAKAALDAALQPQVQPANWWDLPVAASCWRADARAAK